MIVQGLVFKLFGWNKKRAIGKWSQRVVFNQGQVLQETLQGRIGTYVGFLRLMSDLKER
jgi:hypothetical protein